MDRGRLILAVREILGEVFVADKALWELDRRGRFEGRQPVPVAPAGHEPPDPR